MKKVTIKEVAKAAGVGTSTISRYYNGGYVSDENRIKIENVVKELNYHPSSTAKALKCGSNEIAVIVERIYSNTASRFLQEFLITAKKNNLDVTIHVSDFESNTRENIVKQLLEKKVKKIFVLPYEDFDYGAYDKIIIIGQESKKYSYISYDETNAINNILNAVNLDVYKRISIIGYDVNDRSLASRVDLVVKFCKKNKISYDTRFIEFDRELTSSMETMDNTYYFCMTDKIAQIIYFNAQKNQNNVCISGFGDYDISRYIDLTSVDNCYETAARYCIEHLNDQFTYVIQANEKIRWK